jgi:hypothetical protein
MRAGVVPALDARHVTLTATTDAAPMSDVKTLPCYHETPNPLMAVPTIALSALSFAFTHLSFALVPITFLYVG